VTILRSLDSANARRPVPLMKAKGSSRGDPHLPDFLKDAPELRRWHEAHGSIRAATHLPDITRYFQFPYQPK
jgi:hypothetical protein